MLWPTKGKRLPPAPPSLALRVWHERATAAPEGSGAGRDLPEIGPSNDDAPEMPSRFVQIDPIIP